MNKRFLKMFFRTYLVILIPLSAIFLTIGLVKQNQHNEDMKEYDVYRGKSLEFYLLTEARKDKELKEKIDPDTMAKMFLQAARTGVAPKIIEKHDNKNDMPEAPIAPVVRESGYTYFAISCSLFGSPFIFVFVVFVINVIKWIVRYITAP